MKKILLVLILVLSISSFGTSAQNVTTNHFLQKSLDKFIDEIPRRRALKTSQYPKSRRTFLIIPLELVVRSDDTTAYSLTLVQIYVAFCRMYPDAMPPTEFSKFFEAFETEDKLPGYFGASVLPSILLTMASQQGYWIEHVTDNYIILTKPIYEKEQQEKPSSKEAE